MGRIFPLRCDDIFAMIRPADLARRSLEGGEMATSNTNRDTDQLKVAWFASVILAVLIILSFLAVADEAIPDYGANQVEAQTAR
jgi:hypothetical protein